MKERLKQVMRELNMTSNDFAEKIGVKAASISHVLNGRNSPSSVFIEKLFNAIPELNARWFMLGTGEMFSGRVPKAKPISFAGSLFDEDSFKQKISEEKNKPKNNPESKPVAGQASKTIEKIIILYSDKTFIQYDLRQ